MQWRIQGRGGENARPPSQSKFFHFHLCKIIDLGLYLFYKIFAVTGNSEIEQEWIPVGCVSPTSVTITRCQYWGVRSGKGEYPPSFTNPKYTNPLHIPSSLRIPTLFSYPRTYLLPSMKRMTEKN